MAKPPRSKKGTKRDLKSILKVPVAWVKNDVLRGYFSARVRQSIYAFSQRPQETSGARTSRVVMLSKVSQVLKCNFPVH
jgi:hypothetical protein